MIWRRKFTIALVLVLVLAFSLAALLVERYFVEKANSYAAMLKGLDAYWNVSASGAVQREVALIDDAKLRREQRLPPAPNSTSEVQTAVYLQVRQRVNNTQKVRIYVVSRNPNWVVSMHMNGPYSQVFEWWREPPTSDQIKNVIHSSKVQHFGGDVVLRPHQVQLIYTDFVFPYPMKLDFTIVTSFRAHGSYERADKFIVESVKLHGEDLNAAKVVP